MEDEYYYDSYDISEAREQGAEIMRDKMIEEACKWLFENVYDRHCPEDQERVESFKKAMEEII